MFKFKFLLCHYSGVNLIFRCFLVWILLIATDAHYECRYQGSKRGVCMLPKDCTATVGEVIPWTNDCYIHDLYKIHGHMCCPLHMEPEVVVTTTPKPPAEGEFGYNFNKRGLNILRKQKCGLFTASKNPRATNVKAEILEFPWMALLQYEDAYGKREFGCGGSLISGRWVLTAAKCIKRNLVGVRLGEYNLNEGTEKDCSYDYEVKTCTKYKDFKIIKSLTHPGYDEQSGQKDIALIKLETKAKRKNIKPICLPTQKEHFNAPKAPEEAMLIAGWTPRQYGGTVLKKHRFSKQSFMGCYLLFQTPQVDRVDKMCLESMFQREGSTCSGDPGSPVFWLVNSTTNFYTQIGIVPFGMDKCGSRQDEPYYVERVANSMDWITSVLGEET